MKISNKWDLIWTIVKGHETATSVNETSEHHTFDVSNTRESWLFCFCCVLINCQIFYVEMLWLNFYLDLVFVFLSTLTATLTLRLTYVFWVLATYFDLHHHHFKYLKIITTFRWFLLWCPDLPLYSERF